MSTILDEQVTLEVVIDDVTAALWEYQGDKYWRWDHQGMEEAVARVNRGAALLDEARPDWVEQIIPENLDMSDASFCIIGQAYGGFSTNVGIPFGMSYYDNKGEFDPECDLDDPNSKLTLHAISHGFLTEGNGEEDKPVTVPYPLLDRAWVSMLLERSERGRPVTLTLPEPKPKNVIVQILEDNKLLDEQFRLTAYSDLVAAGHYSGE